MDKIKQLFKNICTKEVIFYIIFGILTTLINMGTFYIFTSIYPLDENIANLIAILLAVLVAYFSNRKIVFNSTASNFKEHLIEFFKFILGRAFTMIIEFLGCAILFDIITIPSINITETITITSDHIIKAVITILVIILNFFISKFFAFKKN